MVKRNRRLITAEDFEFFSFLWQMVRDEAHERLEPEGGERGPSRDAS